MNIPNVKWKKSKRVLKHLYHRYKGLNILGGVNRECIAGDARGNGKTHNGGKNRRKVMTDLKLGRGLALQNFSMIDKGKILG